MGLLLLIYSSVSIMSSIASAAASRKPQMKLCSATCSATMLWASSNQQQVLVLFGQAFDQTLESILGL